MMTEIILHPLGRGTLVWLGEIGKEEAGPSSLEIYCPWTQAVQLEPRLNKIGRQTVDLEGGTIVSSIT